jgi:hypothetical protein
MGRIFEVRKAMAFLTSNILPISSAFKSAKIRQKK